MTNPNPAAPLRGKPLTEAGRRLVKWCGEGRVPKDVALETVLTIEIEAADLFDRETRAARATSTPAGLREALYDVLNAHSGPVTLDGQGWVLVRESLILELRRAALQGADR